MTRTDSFVPSERRKRQLTRAAQLLMGCMLVYGLVTLNLGIAGNAGIALAVSFVPALLRREYGYSMDPALMMWIAVALALHVIGSLGFYEWFTWYDNLTHAFSATFVAGVGYALFRTFERHSEEVDIPPNLRSVFVVIFVLAFGVFWEVFEFAVVEVSAALGVESPVTVYGIEDIVTDFIFNTVGALIVALWGTGYFDGVVDFLSTRIRSTERDDAG